mmetsp:Transcript_85809/g.216101  ORF Transcript_85809/g.216101 Transcript_85809/m.216101 type:complete len:83 (-) Transcript_85809:89-337(-)
MSSNHSGSGGDAIGWGVDLLDDPRQVNRRHHPPICTGSGRGRGGRLLTKAIPAKADGIVHWAWQAEAHGRGIVEGRGDMGIS